MSERLTVPADHPALPGHFPGRPVVPAVLILDAALHAVGADRPGARIIAAKFTTPLAPEQTLVLTSDIAASGVVSVSGRIGGVPAFGARIRPPADRTG